MPSTTIIREMQREELERHRQAIELSLTMLGEYVIDSSKEVRRLTLNPQDRTMDVSAAMNIKNLDSKLNAGTAASLSKTEEQSIVLERIESHAKKKTRAERSADSVQSLQSIASSVSRIEVLATSVAGASLSQRSKDSKESNQGEGPNGKP